EARGVRGEDRFWLAGSVERAEQLALEIEVLAHGLDDQIAVREFFERRRALEIRERLLHVGGRQLALVDAALEELLDRAEALVEQRLRHFAHHGRESRGGAHL